MTTKITIKEAAKRYGVSEVTIYNWRYKGLINHYRLAGRTYVDTVEIEGAMVPFGNAPVKV